MATTRRRALLELAGLGAFSLAGCARPTSGPSSSSSSRAWTFAMARWSQQSTFDQTSVDFYLDYRPLHYLRENR